MRLRQTPRRWRLHAIAEGGGSAGEGASHSAANPPCRELLAGNYFAKRVRQVYKSRHRNSVQNPGGDGMRVPVSFMAGRQPNYNHALINPQLDENQAPPEFKNSGPANRSVRRRGQPGLSLIHI